MMRSRRAGPSAGAGAISMSFWWRRWMLQSRSPKCVTAPVRVARDLDLDVAGAGNPALHVEAGVAEGLPRLGGAALEGGLDLVRLGDGAHPPPAAPRDGLDEHPRALRQVAEEGARLLLA